MSNNEEYIIGSELLSRDEMVSFLENHISFDLIKDVYADEINKELDARDIVFEYMKLNTQLPIEIIKELGKDEVYRIIERFDWHV